MARGDHMELGWWSGARAAITSSGCRSARKWTEGTGFTENGIIVDGRLTKLGSELRWDYDWDDPMQPWHVVDPGGQLDVVLTPRFDKHSKIDGAQVGSETHQVFGTWSGRARAPTTASSSSSTELQGFAEEARQHW